MNNQVPHRYDRQRRFGTIDGSLTRNWFSRADHRKRAEPYDFREQHDGQSGHCLVSRDKKQKENRQ